MPRPKRRLRIKGHELPKPEIKVHGVDLAGEGSDTTVLQEYRKIINAPTPLGLSQIMPRGFHTGGYIGGSKTIAVSETMYRELEEAHRENSLPSFAGNTIVINNNVPDGMVLTIEDGSDNSLTLNDEVSILNERVRVAGEALKNGLMSAGSSLRSLEQAFKNIRKAITKNPEPDDD